MKINEHEVGTEVKFVPRVGDAFCYASYILPSMHKDNVGYILVEPVKVAEGKYANFNGLSCVIEVCPKGTGQVYRYNITRMGYIRWKAKDYFAVFSDDDVDFYNRRSQFRLPTLMQAQLQLGRHTRVYDCYLRDVSYNGFALTLHRSETFKCELGTAASVSFIDKDTGERHKVVGKVVRCEEKESNPEYVSLGVYMDVAPKPWVLFVSKLQRIELQRLRGSDK